MVDFEFQVSAMGKWVNFGLRSSRGTVTSFISTRGQRPSERYSHDVNHRLIKEHVNNITEY
jgi:hypothetical protein